MGIYLFFAGCTFLVLYSLFADFSESIWDKLKGISEKKKVMSHFQSATVYYVKGGRPYLFLNSKGLSIDHDEGVVFFTSPTGNTFTSDGEEVFYQSKMGNFSQKAGTLKLVDEVILETENSKITSDSLNYTINEGMAISSGNVKSYLYVPKSKDKIYINSDKLESNIPKELADYRGNVKGRLVRTRSYEEGVQFKTDHLFFNLPQMEARLHGDVSLKKQRLTATSREGQLFL
ncbi:MAG: LPS export ABC transporter periplasmic protein LptC, partial [Bacteriovoracaceae bacterium]|nr:LPS export ABC transporter periplasmic protein LptC [Bacteriovoracaceae bacterium]